VIVGGRLTAVGRPDAPISFRPIDPEQAPWGALVLRGRGADGSTLRWCDIRCDQPG
jgi:hypothetical protein